MATARVRPDPQVVQQLARGRIIDVMDVEILVVPGCAHEAVAVQRVRTAMIDLGLSTKGLRVTVIASENEAAEGSFTGSPTFMVNGIDPFAEPGRRIGMSCRIYHHDGQLSGVPELSALHAALHAAVDSAASKVSNAECRPCHKLDQRDQPSTGG
jgi:hypothetical protein